MVNFCIHACYFILLVITHNCGQIMENIFGKPLLMSAVSSIWWALCIPTYPPIFPIYVIISLFWRWWLFCSTFNCCVLPTHIYSSRWHSLSWKLDSRLFDSFWSEIISVSIAKCLWWKGNVKQQKANFSLKVILTYRLLYWHYRV